MQGWANWVQLRGHCNRCKCNMDQLSTPSVQESGSNLNSKEHPSNWTTSEEIQDSEFKQFHEYDFHSDENFLNGWRRIPDQGNLDNYIKAKAFYYSREFSAVSVDGYKQWLVDNQLTDKGPPKVSNEESRADGDTAEKQSVQKDSVPSDNDTASLSVTNDKNSEDKNSESISFGQVIDFIEKGLSLPGIKNLNIETVNADPKPSEIQRKKKPWEQDT